MFIKNKKNSWIDEEIKSILDQMQSMTADSSEYARMLAQVEKLNSMKTLNKKEKIRVSPDTLVSAGASLGGILLILIFEKASVMTTKSLPFVIKSKI